METDDRRLCVFFEALGTRYAVEAVRVLEVARPPTTDDALHGNLMLRDLPMVLGGISWGSSNLHAALVLESSPTLAVRIGTVEGVFDSSAVVVTSLTRRLIPLLAPAVRNTLVREGKLYFELDTDAVGRGLPAHTKRPEIISPADDSTSCLVFDSGESRFAVALPHVRQIIALDGAFNRAPGRGAFVGVVHHGHTNFPVFSLTGTEPEALIVLLELPDGGVGLCARRADGVKREHAGLTVLDALRMFS